jgi:structural maintenance of chromosome 3 (chondroitin sulfate proteoglycan 6)
MGREERQALLHEGTGSAIMSAYVELVFANCEGRFQTANDELTLRRTIGLKKDEYSVDRKNTTKHEVMQMLETAGFSRANPYYIVPQGRITRLTNMKDPERLDLLKSVAGTQHFTVKKEESLKIMNDTNNKLAEIDDLFKQISDRLSELEEEQDELRDFQEQDREKRGLEYTLFHREQEEINKVLESIEGKRAGGIDDADEDRERHAAGEEVLTRITQQIQALKQEMHAAKLEKKQLEEDRREKAKTRAQVDLDVKNLEHGQDAAKQAKASRAANLKTLTAQITEADKELKKITPKFKADSEKEQAVKTQLDIAEATQQRLYAKQGRSARFKSKKDRDDWLQAQINETFEALSRFKATKMQTTEGIQDDKKAIAQLEKDINEMQQTLGTGVESFEKEIEKATEDKDSLIDERKTLWRKEAQFDSEYAAAQDQLRKAERNLSHMMDGNTSRGLEAVRRIKQQYNLTGCYGTLAELITVEQHHTAVEVVAGNSLFHYVVDNDDTATKVMDILNKERAGRVTFMPLNRLQSKTANFPQAQDARLLMTLIKCDKKYEKAVQQVFGKAIIAQNLSVAAQYARTHGLTAVTPEGDRSDKKGALTGGYHDTKNSRLKGTKTLAEARNRFNTIKVEGSKTKKEIEKMDQRITKAVGEVQKLEQRRNQAQTSQHSLRIELRNKAELLDRKRSELEAKEKQSQAIDASVTSLSNQQTTYQDEVKSDFKKALSQAEETQLENLTKSIQQLRKEHGRLADARAESEAKKTDIEVRLNSNLNPQLTALEGDELEADSGSSSGLQSRQRELDRLNKDYDTVQQRLTELETLLDSKSAEVGKLEAKEAETRRAQEELAKGIERHQRRLEKSIQKKAALVASKQDLVESMRELGAVPDDTKIKFRKLKSEDIVKRLQKAKESLKKYTSVNKHAFEHYRKSLKQREELDARRTELETAKESIQELVEVLDQRKDEAIERTFKQVSRAFAEVFIKLVPAGRGRLIIQRKQDAPTADDKSDDEVAANKKGVENYTGVTISVSFNSKHDDQQRIQQLSGGQKSKSLPDSLPLLFANRSPGLCSLALIFAIQATDPAPFYIFDEIDANLDAQYRTAVADHLHFLANKGNEEPANGGERSMGGQFICTTFRPEMLRVAEKCYGVTFANNLSAIRTETLANALDFVESQAQ